MANLPPIVATLFRARNPSLKDFVCLGDVAHLETGSLFEGVPLVAYAESPDCPLCEDKQFIRNPNVCGEHDALFVACPQCGVPASEPMAAPQPDEAAPQGGEVPRPVGYIRDTDLQKWLREGPQYGSISLDHPRCWEEEEPYAHLVPLYAGKPLIERRYPEWISVNDQLPAIDTQVLVCTEFDGPGDWRVSVGGLDSTLADSPKGPWWLKGGSWKPSHWMPLPPGAGEQLYRGPTDVGQVGIDGGALFPPAFITTASGGGIYELSLRFGTLKDLHAAHDRVLELATGTEPDDVPVPRDVLSEAVAEIESLLALVENETGMGRSIEQMYLNGAPELSVARKLLALLGEEGARHG